MLDEAERRARFAISLTNLSFANFLKILEEYGSMSRFLDSGRAVQAIGAVQPVQSERARQPVYAMHQNYLPDIDSYDLTEVPKDEFIVYGDEYYPDLLAQTPFPPIALSFRGDIRLLKSPNLISIVGTRKHSSYGARITKEIVNKLSGKGFVFVSGMALGIDTIVHKAALKANAKTIAVLPTTLDNPSPKSNYRLFKEIAQSGLVICEPKYKYIWDKYLYAQRNRIIAGLAPLTLVTEAPAKSGALITANLAFEYNREVYAVPGNIDGEFSSGCNWLIKNNKAQLFSDIHDILPAQLPITDLKKSVAVGNSRDLEEPESLTRSVVKLLKVEALAFDDLSDYLKIKDSLLKETLLELEIQGIICLNSNGKYNMKVD